MRRGTWVILVAGLLLPAAVLHAGEPSPSPDAVAAIVLERIAAGDDDALTRIAQADTPDAWLVADALHARGRLDAARRLAQARADAGKHLATYLGGFDARSSEDPRRTALARARDEFDAGFPHKALRWLERFPDRQRDVPGLMLTRQRAFAARTLGRHAKSAAGFAQSASDAQAIGWLRFAATAWHEAARSAHRSGDLVGAEKAWTAQLRIDEGRKHDPGVLAALGNLGVLAQQRGNHALALELQRKCLTLGKRLKDPRAQARALGNIGGLHLLTGAPEKARSALEDALALQEGLDDTGNVARLHTNLGLAFESEGRLREALTLQQAALTAFEATGDVPATAATALAMGSVLSRLGESDRALALLQRSLRLYEELKDAAGRARALGELGATWLRTEDTTRALDCHERCLRLTRALGDEVGETYALGNIAVVHERRGDYAGALRHYEETLERTRRLDDRAAEATTLLNLGVLHACVGRTEDARTCYESAEAIQREIGDLDGLALVLGNLGRLHARAGNAAEALDLHKQALEVAAKLDDPVGRATALAGLGDLHLRDGRLSKAREHLASALRLSREARDPLGVSLALVSLAEVHRRAGEETAARTTLNEALKTAQGAAARTATLLSLQGLARLENATGNHEAAVRHARNAVDGLALLVRGHDDERGATAREMWTDVFAAGLDASLALGDSKGAWHFLESGRAGTLLEAMGGREALLRHVVAPTLRREEAAAHAKEQRAAGEYRALLARGAKLSEVRRGLRNLKAARRRGGGRGEPGARGANGGGELLYPRPVRLEAMQALLGDGEVLVVYGLRERRSVALVVRSTSVVMRELASRAKIESAWRALMVDQDAFVSEGAATEVRRLLVAPLGLEASDHRIIVSPDGVLAYLPHALVWPDREVYFMPSGTTYALLAEHRGLRGREILGLGDPDYAGHEMRTLRPLPASRAEVEAVSDVAFLGREASKTSFVRALPTRQRWRCVHFACHGLISDEHPALSCLALSAGDGDDGRLTIHDILRLEVNTDLVVLSACESGRGRIVRGEGTLGLTRAFMFAGSPRVIVSLWLVDDDATQALMRAFYAAWSPKGDLPGGADRPSVSVGAALRAAQAHVRNQPKWRHAQYWAPWVVWGIPAGEGSARLVLSVAEAAKHVQGAVAADDRTSVRRIADGADPDPWAVTEHLCATGRRAVAATFVEHADGRPDVAGLAAYVASRSATTKSDSWRPSLQRALGLLRQGDAARALAALPAADEDRPGVAHVRIEHARARVLRDLGRRSESAEAFEAAGRRAEKIGWLREASTCLEQRGTLAFRVARFEAAAAAWHRQVDIERRRAEPAALGRALGNLGVALQHRGALEPALAVLQESRRVLHAAGEQKSEVRTLNNLAALHIALGSTEEARQVVERALTRQAVVDDPPVHARLLAGLAITQEDAGLYREAEATYRRAVKVLESTRDPRGLADVLGYLGRLLETDGRWEEALVCHRRALSTMRAEDNSPGEARCLEDVGAVQRQRLALEEAERTLGQAAEIWEYLANDAGRTRTLGGLGLVLEVMGDLHGARHAHEASLACARAGNDATGTAVALSAVARVLGEAGLDERATTAYGEALAQWSTRSGTTHVDTLLDRAFFLARRGERDASSADLDRAQEVARTLADEPSLRRVNEARRAIALTAESLLERAEDAGDEALREAIEFLGTAEGALRDGKPDRSYADARRALEMSWQEPWGRDPADTRRAALLRDRAIDVGLAAAFRAGNAEGFAALGQFAEAVRTYTAQGGWRALAAKLLDPDALRRMAQRAAGIARAHASEAEPQDREQLLGEARTQWATWLARRRSEAPADTNLLVPVPLTLADISQRIGPTAALVVYEEIDDRLIALVASEGKGRLVDLGPRTDIVRALGGSPDVARLRGMLLAPLGLDGSVRLVYVRPPAQLTGIPFGEVAQGMRHRAVDAVLHLIGEGS